MNRRLRACLTYASLVYNCVFTARPCNSCSHSQSVTFIHTLGYLQFCSMRRVCEYNNTIGINWSGFRRLAWKYHIVFLCITLNNDRQTIKLIFPSLGVWQQVESSTYKGSLIPGRTSHLFSCSHYILFHNVLPRHRVDPSGSRYGIPIRRGGWRSRASSYRGRRCGKENGPGSFWDCKLHLHRRPRWFNPYLVLPKCTSHTWKCPAAECESSVQLYYISSACCKSPFTPTLASRLLAADFSLQQPVPNQGPDSNMFDPWAVSLFLAWVASGSCWCRSLRVTYHMIPRLAFLHTQYQMYVFVRMCKLSHKPTDLSRNQMRINYSIQIYIV